MAGLYEELQRRQEAAKREGRLPGISQPFSASALASPQASEEADLTGRPKPGVLSSLLQGIVKAPARTVATAYRASRGSNSIALALGYLAMGDSEAAKKVLEEEGREQQKESSQGSQLGKDVAGAGKAVGGPVGGALQLAGGAFGLAGPVKPVGTEGGTGKQLADIVGTGAELSTFVVPAFGGAKAGVAARSLGAAVKTGAAAGALSGGFSGAVSGFGQGLEEADDLGDMWDVFKRTLGGAALGAGVGGVLGGAAAGGGYLAGKASKAFQQGARKGQIQQKVYADKQEFINEKVSDLSEKVKAGYGLAGPGAQNEPDEKALRRLVEDALDMGLDQKDVNMILDDASPEDVAAMRKIFDTAKAQSKTNVPSRRTTDEVGETFMKPIRHIMGVKDRTGNQLGEFTREMANKPEIVDVTLDKKLLLREIQGQLGARVSDQLDDAGKVIGTKIDFSESNVANNAKAQKLIKSVVDALPEGPDGRVKVTDLRLHRLRQQIFSDLAMGKQEGWLTEATPILLTNTRERLIWKIDDKVPGYADWARAHAIASDTLADFWQKVGYAWQDKPQEFIEKRAGQIGQRLLMLQNAPYEELVNHVDEVAAASGFQSDANLQLQSSFALQMNRLFGVGEQRGFEKSIQSAVEKAGEGTFRETTEAVAGGKAGIARAVTKKFIKSQQVSREQVIDVIDKLLSAADIAAKRGQDVTGGGAASVFPGPGALDAVAGKGVADIVRDAERMVASGRKIPEALQQALASFAEDSEVNEVIKRRINALIGGAFGK